MHNLVRPILCIFTMNHSAFWGKYAKSGLLQDLVGLNLEQLNNGGSERVCHVNADPPTWAHTWVTRSETPHLSCNRLRQLFSVQTKVHYSFKTGSIVFQKGLALLDQGDFCQYCFEISDVQL